MLFMGKKLIIGIVVFAVVLLAAILFTPLLSFGVLSADNLVPERCNSPPVFGCEDYGLEGDTLELTLTNQVGLTISEMSVSFQNREDSCEVDFGGEFLTVGNGASVVCSNLEDLSDGINHFDLEVEYRSQGVSDATAVSVELAVR